MSFLSVMLSLFTCIINSVCVCRSPNKEGIGGGGVPSLVALDASVASFHIAQLGSCIFPLSLPTSHVA